MAELIVGAVYLTNRHGKEEKNFYRKYFGEDRWGPGWNNPNYAHGDQKSYPNNTGKVIVLSYDPVPLNENDYIPVTLQEPKKKPVRMLNRPSV
jgi:hypothetical protein